MRTFLCAFSVLSSLILAIVSAVHAAEEPALKARLDPLVKPVIESRAAVGLAIGVIQDGRTHTFGYGRLSAAPDEAAKKAPDERTLFEIGSVTKVFTALALAQMVQEKQVALDDPVAKHLPESVKVPERDGKPITLLHLATHTSGLPRLPANFTPHLFQSFQDPYAKYSVEEMYAGLGESALASVPGEKYVYSNLGVGLLGHVLARRAGMSYEELIRKKVCEPLGLEDTRITLAGPLASRLVQGHDADCRPIPPWHITTLAGAGAICSDVHDLLRFVEANIEPRKTPLAEAIEATHAARHDADMAKTRIALGWHIWADEGIHWHNGQTGGYHSFVGFHKERKVGVVVLSNTAGGVADGLGHQVLKLLLGQPVEPLKLKVPAHIDPAVLARYVGNYELYPGATLAVTRDGDQLFARMTGQPAYRLYPESETKFYYRVVDAQITFVADKDGTVSKLVLHQHGLNLPAWKHGLAIHFGKQLLKVLSTPEGKKASPDGAEAKQ